MAEYFFEQDPRDPSPLADDQLNEETFGEGAVEDDWESSHYSRVRELEGKTLSLHDANDVITKAISSDNHTEQQEEKEVVSSLAQMKIKELWPSSPERASHLDSIWSSPELPPVSRKLKSSPSAPVSGKVRTLEDLERELTSSSPPPPHPSHRHTPPPYPPQQYAPQPTRSGPLPPPPGLMRMAPPPLAQVALPMHPQIAPQWHQHRGRFPPPPPHMLPPPPHIALIRGPPFMPPHGVPGPMMPPPHPHYPHYPPPPPHAHHPPPPQRHHPPPPTTTRSKRSEFLNELKPDGSGFMTQKEKDWVIKVQLLQLQSQDPSTDDYYYQHYMQRKVSKERQAGGSDSPPTHVLALPQISREERSYKPVEFKGTLGKLSVSTISAPRKTIDIPTSGSEGPGGGGRDAPARKKQTLMIIEKLYSLVLSLEDLERRALSLPEEDRSLVLAQRDELCSEIFSLLRLKTLDQPWCKGDEQVFQHMMTCRKGKRVIGRALPLLSNAHAHAVVLSLVRNMAAIIKRDASDQVLPELMVSVVAVIASMNLDMINRVVSVVVERGGGGGGGGGAPTAVRIAQNEVGSLILLALVKKGRDVASTDQTNHMQERWGEVTQLLCEELLTHKEQLVTAGTSSSTLLTTLTELTS